MKNVDELCALSKAKAGTLSYLAPGAPLVLYMETLKKEKGCRLGARAVPRRRRGGQRDHERLDADRACSARATSSATSSAGKMTPLVMMNNIRSPNFPKVPLLDRGRLQRAAVAELVRHVRAGRHAEGRSSTRCRKDIGEIVNKPEFRDRHLTARSLVPAANTPEQFAEDIKRERVVAEKVVKDAGFEPQ